MRTLTADQAETLDAMGETLVPGAQAGRHRPFRRSADFDPAGGGAARGAHPQRAPALCEFLSRRARRDRRRQQGEHTAAAASPQLNADRAARFRRSDAPEQDRRLARAAPGFVYSCCAPTPSTSSTAPWTAMPRLGVPYMPHIAPTQEVVTWQTKKSMSSSSAPARRARSMPRCWRKAGKKVVLLETGPDWQLERSDQLGFLGPPHQAGRAAVPARRQESVRLRLPGRLGRRRRGAALLRQFPAR